MYKNWTAYDIIEKEVIFEIWLWRYYNDVINSKSVFETKFGKHHPTQQIWCFHDFWFRKKGKFLPHLSPPSFAKNELVKLPV